MGSKVLGIPCSNIFLDASPWARGTTTTKNKMGLHQTKKVLHSKGNHQQNEKTTH